MDLTRYRVPASAREGVLIELDGSTGAPFLVRLPSRYNREYTAAQQRALGAKLGEDGRPDLSTVDFVAWREARLMAFLDHCVAELPAGVTREMLLDEYRPALEALYDRAEELANDEDAEAIETTKKSSA